MERLSGWMDGDLDDRAAADVLDTVLKDKSSRHRWETYCLIGDVLRDEPVIRADFTARVMAEIEMEQLPGTPSVHSETSTLIAQHRRAANQKHFFWRRMMPVAASLAGVLAVAQVAYQVYFTEPEIPLASTGIPAMTQAAKVAETTTTGLDQNDVDQQYLFVHQARAGGGPLPGALQYIRTVSDNGRAMHQ